MRVLLRRRKLMRWNGGLRFALLEGEPTAALVRESIANEHAVQRFRAVTLGSGQQLPTLPSLPDEPEEEVAVPPLPPPPLRAPQAPTDLPPATSPVTVPAPAATSVVQPLGAVAPVALEEPAGVAPAPLQALRAAPSPQAAPLTAAPVAAGASAAPTGGDADFFRERAAEERKERELTLKKMSPDARAAFLAEEERVSCPLRASAFSSYRVTDPPRAPSFLFSPPLRVLCIFHRRASRRSSTTAPRAATCSRRRAPISRSIP